jgi:hypothetical protein
MAESVSLAVLENLVHMSRKDFPTGYVIVAAVIPDGLSMLTDSELRVRFPGASTRKLGDLWADSRATCVLRVNSAVVRAEHNYLRRPFAG